MDSDFKWFAMIFIGLFICMAIQMSITSYNEAITAKAAMENGYEQVQHGNQLIWKKKQMEQLIWLVSVMDARKSTKLEEDWVRIPYWLLRRL